MAVDIMLTCKSRGESAKDGCYKQVARILSGGMKAVKHLIFRFWRAFLGVIITSQKIIPMATRGINSGRK